MEEEASHATLPSTTLNTPSGPRTFAKAESVVLYCSGDASGRQWRQRVARMSSRLRSGRSSSCVWGGGGGGAGRLVEGIERGRDE